MRYIVLIIAFIGCTEPFQFDTPDEDIEVIDAKISTIQGNSYIDIYLISDGEKLPLCNFDVRVISESGTVIEFECSGSTRYTPIDETFAAQVGESYRLEATNETGRVYASGFDLIPEPLDFEFEVKDTTDTFLSTQNVLVTRDVKSILTQILPESNIFYAKFEFYYSYRDHFSGDSIDVKNEEQYALLTNVNDRFSNTLTFLVGIQERTDWYFWDYAPSVPCEDANTCSSPCCGNPCCFYTENWPVSVYVVQEVLSKESFEFWENAQRLRDNNGLVFDTYPFPLNGNIACEECDKPFVGFFRAVAETSKRQPTIL